MQLETLKQMAQEVLALAKQAGASGAEVDVSYGSGQNVSVRLGEVENIEFNRDKGISITVYSGQKKGFASTSDFSPAALRNTVQAAYDIAKYTAADDCAGLADAELMASNLVDLDLHHPWKISTDEALEIAKTCEQAAMGADTRIANSEGASVYTSEGVFAYANSHGFVGGYASSNHSVSASVIAQQGEIMQRDYWYSAARDAADLQSAEWVGKKAGERAAQRLNIKPIKTGKYPVLFEAPLAKGLIGSLISAISGGNLYRKSSFLLDTLGQQIAASNLTIIEDPFVRKGAASSAFDGEGVATRKRILVENGVLNGYLLGSYSARKLGMQTTANAGGAHNLVVQSTGENFEALLKKMHTGLLVTELLGHGMNMVTGDYSRGAAGYWVQNGVIQHAVEEITIAANFKEMLKQIVAIGDDVIPHSARLVGSILLAEMTVAASE